MKTITNLTLLLLLVLSGQAFAGRLHDAVRARDLALVNKYITEGDSATEREELLSRGCLGPSPLDLALSLGYEEIVLAIYKRSIRRIANFDGLFRFRGGDLARLKELLARALRGQLHDAVRAGDKGLVEELVTAGADIQEEDVDGDTPVVLAARLGHDEIVRTLFMQGYIGNRESCACLAPFLWAVSCDKDPILVAALARDSQHFGVSFDNMGREELDIAVHSRTPLAMVQAVCLHPDIDINCYGSGVFTPVLAAARQGQKKVVDFFSQDRTFDFVKALSSAANCVLGGEKDSIDKKKDRAKLLKMILRVMRCWLERTEAPFNPSEFLLRVCLIRPGDVVCSYHGPRGWRCDECAFAQTGVAKFLFEPEVRDWLVTEFDIVIPSDVIQQGLSLCLQHTPAPDDARGLEAFKRGGYQRLSQALEKELESEERLIVEHSRMPFLLAKDREDAFLWLLEQSEPRREGMPCCVPSLRSRPCNGRVLVFNFYFFEK